jgi:AcrR family transcriptional regulator
MARQKTEVPASETGASPHPASQKPRLHPLREGAGAVRVSGSFALILAAERLFAEGGASAVSLRQVSEAAGQRNPSATHYHFGTREGLVRAVAQHRMQTINQHRLDILTNLAKTKKLRDARALIAALVYPLAQELERRPEGNYYLRFLERYMRERLRYDFRIDRKLRSGWIAVNDALRPLLKHLPEPVTDLRVRIMAEQVISGLSAVEADLAAGSFRRGSLPVVVETLIDTITAGIMTPASAEAKEALVRLPSPAPRKRRLQTK